MNLNLLQDLVKKNWQVNRIAKVFNCTIEEVYQCAIKNNLALPMHDITDSDKLVLVLSPLPKVGTKTKKGKIIYVNTAYRWYLIDNGKYKEAFAC